MKTDSPRPAWARDHVLERVAAGAVAHAREHDLAIEEISLGLPISWAIVRDAQGRRALGTALTPVAEAGDREMRFAGLAEDWTAWSLADLPPRIMANDPIERALALATTNAISQHKVVLEERRAFQNGHDRPSVARWVRDQGAERVVVIGNMRPLIAELETLGVPHVVFERSLTNRPGAMSDAHEWAWLAEADGLIMTGATLVNHTLAPLLALSPRARFRLLVGFSAQAHPSFLVGSGVTHIFSMHVREIDATRRHLQVGNWRRFFTDETGYLATVADGEQDD